MKTAYAITLAFCFSALIAIALLIEFLRNPSEFTRWFQRETDDENGD